MAGEFDEAGEVFPNLVLYDLNGDPVNLYDYAEEGKPLVISLCAMWCGPCRTFASDLDGLAAAYGDSYTFIELVYQDQFFQTADLSDAQLWASVYGLKDVPVLHVGGNGALADTLVQGTSLVSVPTYVILDPATGEVLGLVEGYAGPLDFIAALDALAPAEPLVIEGTKADDIIEGGAGDDLLSGLSGDDSINGFDGDDQIDGGRDDDALFGGDGDDNVDGGNGNDLIDGGAGDDSLTGGNGNDVIDAGDGNDTIDAGNGDDLVGGGAGDDMLDGGNGNDIIRDGAGFDVVTGGSGMDLFVFDLGSEGATVTDFSAEDDSILFETLGLADLSVTVAQDGTTAVLRIAESAEPGAEIIVEVMFENADASAVLDNFEFA